MSRTAAQEKQAQILERRNLANRSLCEIDEDLDQKILSNGDVFRKRTEHRGRERPKAENTGSAMSFLEVRDGCLAHLRLSSANSKPEMYLPRLFHIKHEKKQVTIGRNKERADFILSAKRFPTNINPMHALFEIVCPADCRPDQIHQFEDTPAGHRCRVTEMTKDGEFHLFVNGIRVTSSFLKHGDKICFGSPIYEYTYEISALSQTENDYGNFAGGVVPMSKGLMCLQDLFWPTASDGLIEAVYRASKFNVDKTMQVLRAMDPSKDYEIWARNDGTVLLKDKKTKKVVNLELTTRDYVKESNTTYVPPPIRNPIRRTSQATIRTDPDTESIHSSSRARSPDGLVGEEDMLPGRRSKKGVAQKFATKDELIEKVHQEFEKSMRTAEAPSTDIGQEVEDAEELEDQ